MLLELVVGWLEGKCNNFTISTLLRDQWLSGQTEDEEPPSSHHLPPPPPTQGTIFPTFGLTASFFHILCFNVSCQEGGASKIKMVLIGPKFAKISICLHCCMGVMECQQCSSKFTSTKNSPPDGFYQRILPVIPPCGWPLGSERATVTQWKSLQQLGIWICANSLVTWPRCSG